MEKLKDYPWDVEYYAGNEGYTLQSFATSSSEFS